MKSNSNVRPETFHDLGNGCYHYNFNIVEASKKDELGNDYPTFDFDTVEIWGNPTYEKCVKAVIADKYDYSTEIALINKYNAFTLEIDTDIASKEGYLSYLQFVRGVKVQVKQDLNII